MIIMLIISACTSGSKSNSEKQNVQDVDSLNMTNAVDQLNPENTFPFSESSRIEFISYPTRQDWDQRPVGEQSVISEVLVSDGKVAFDSTMIKESVFIDANQSTKLFDVLYKTECIGNDTYFCYDPRNAIFFYDQNNQIIAAIEICFDCQNYIVSDGLEGINLCNNHMELLGEVFTEAGITYFGEE